jgi:hypothetical protein
MSTASETPTTVPRWVDTTIDRIVNTYCEAICAHGARLPTWHDLPIESRLVLIAVFCAGRRDVQ